MRGEYGDCVEAYHIFRVCRGDYVILKVGRETMKGRVTAVSPLGIVLDNRTAVRLSRINWLVKVEEGREGDGDDV